MPTSTKAYEYFFKDAIEPITDASMHLVQSTIARMHVQHTYSNQFLSYIFFFLTFKAGNVLLAINQKFLMIQLFHVLLLNLLAMMFLFNF